MTSEKSVPISRSGRFRKGPSEGVQKFTQSVSFDHRLWKHDIVGSIAHARMLASIGILSQEEFTGIETELIRIGDEILNGEFEWKEELEDVHMNIEAALTERLPAGAKLHTARSRNDQIALDTRMWLRDELLELVSQISDLQTALVKLSKRYPEVILPGYTHLQRAQPVWLAHHLLAYVEMFDRDYRRFQDAFDRLNVCPLGSGAIAGSTLPLKREEVAGELGFVDATGAPRVSHNSMDAVSDRDYMVEVCAHGALMGIHLSRLAEDWILWNTKEFGFIRISDEFTTGSSLMPQKKNPDIAELIRGKSGRLNGNLMHLLTLLKGLPLTYNRDLQEDKEPLFDTMDTLRSSVELMAQMISGTEFLVENCREAASDPSLLATDLTDELVRLGIPFRQSHHIVGELVASAESLNKGLDQLTKSELKAVHPLLVKASEGIFDLARAMDRRELIGAPGRKQVRKELARWTKTLKERLA